MTIQRILAVGTLALGLLAGVENAPVAAQDYVVVVNQAAGVTRLSKKEVSDAFLGRLASFPGGVDVEPVDHKADATIRESFSQGVHGRAANAVVAYWLQQVYSGKGTPPPEATDDAAILRAVAANPGGIGYVSAGASLPRGVVALTVSG